MAPEHIPALILFLIGSVVCEELKNCICGVPKVTSNVKVTDPNFKPIGNKHPWMVAIRRKVKQSSIQYRHSTGTLVSDQFVVTAASVFDHESDTTKSEDDANLYEVKPGAEDWEEEAKSETIKWQPIEEIWIHPYFNNKQFAGRGLGYNVALLKLKSKLVFFHEQMAIKGVRPICLPTPDQTKLEDLVGKIVVNGRALASTGMEKILANADCVSQHIPTKPR